MKAKFHFMNLGRRLRVQAIALLLAAPGFASTWGPVPPHLWALRDGGVRDAVVVERRTVLSNNQIETLCRIRILRDAGKAAADLPPFPPECHHIGVRVALPDGSSVEGEGPGAFEAAPPGAQGPRIRPRGLSADCIVDLRWQESAWRKHASPLPRRLGRFAEWRVGGPFPTLRETFELIEGFRWPCRVLPGRAGRPGTTQEAGYRIITFSDLPAFPGPVPDQPRFQVFELPRVLHERAAAGSDAFWKAVLTVPIPRLITRDRLARPSDRAMNTSRVFKDVDPSVKDSFVGFVHTGRAYRALSQELTADLPPAPQARARELARRLAPRVTPNREPVVEPEEREDMEEEDRIRSGPENLEEAVKAGRTTAKGMAILAFRLLRDAGLEPKLALLVDGRVRPFDYDAPIAWQFTDHLLGVDEPGHDTLWLDPSRLLAGGILPGLRGSEGLLVDTGTWEFRRFRLGPASGGGL
jgi:hypothetical protein